MITGAARSDALRGSIQARCILFNGTNRACNAAVAVILILRFVRCSRFEMCRGRIPSGAVSFWVASGAEQPANSTSQVFHCFPSFFRGFSRSVPHRSGRAVLCRARLSVDFHVVLLVLRERIELSASPLPRECSTTELPQLSRKQILEFLERGRMSHRPGS